MGLGKKKILSQGASDDGGYFETITYGGTGSTQSTNSLSSQSGTIDFQPDLIWFKNRTGAYPYQMYNSITGVDKFLNTGVATTIGSYTGTGAELNDSGNDLMSFNSNGFTIGAPTFGSVNEVGFNHVAWCFKAGGAAVSNTDGNVTAQVSANQAAGFSIASYTGNGAANATVGHGLGAVPELIITRNRNGSFWNVGSPYIGGFSNYMTLNNGDASLVSGSPFNGTAPTSSVVTFGTYSATNGSNGPMIMYCFRSVAGVQKVGSYTGSGSSGKSVTTGFQPRFLMIKATSFGNGYWFILDNQRATSGTNGKKALWANTLLAEGSTDYDVRFDATGFTLLNTDSHLNQSYNYLYLAIA